jgi:VanZ family protein
VFDARRRGQVRWLWLAALVVVITGSLLPADSTPMNALDLLGISDKVEHFSAYFGLAFLALTGFERRGQALAIAASMVLLGGALELLQHFSPGRTPDSYDALANAAGAVVGILIGAVARQRLNGS